MNHLHRHEPLLGTAVHIDVHGPQPAARLETEVTKAFELVRGVGRLMDFNEADSDVARLNRCAHVAPLRVHPWTWQVIEKALGLSADTEGAFDITIAPRQVRNGHLPRHGSFRSMGEAAQWDHIEMLEGSRIRFRQPLMIDLAEIARGFAVDKAIDWLATRGLAGAMVKAGGDLRIHGKGLSVPRAELPAEERLPGVMLRPAVATSAAYFARRPGGLARVPPIAHPRTGKPLRSNVSVSVFADTCTQAEALTKAVLLAPQSLWNRALQEANSLALFITRQDEQVLYPA